VAKTSTVRARNAVPRRTAPMIYHIEYSRCGLCSLAERRRGSFVLLAMESRSAHGSGDGHGSKSIRRYCVGPLLPQTERLVMSVDTDVMSLIK
jgi:hypothetical protein